MLFDWLVPALLALLVVITFWIALRRPPVDSSVERQARERGEQVQAPNVTLFKNKADFEAFHLKAGEV